jgi:DNA-directed RNA polymerase specialized sigma24 family protein
MTGPDRAKPKIDQDYELVKAIQAGRNELFTELVQRYERPLYHFGLKMCAEPRDAEDVVQETFLNAFKYLKDFRYETKFKNWLYRIATSNCIKKTAEVQIRTRTRALPGRIPAPGRSCGGSSGACLGDPAAGPAFK